MPTWTLRRGVMVIGHKLKENILKLRKDAKPPGAILGEELKGVLIKIKICFLFVFYEFLIIDNQYFNIPYNAFSILTYRTFLLFS